MQFSVPIFLVVLVLGVVQLAVGVVFGRLLPIRSPGKPNRQQPDPSALRVFGYRLFELVRHVADDVGEHRLEIEQANEQLTTAPSGDPTDTAEFVLHSVARIVEINERLQSRLAATEEKIQEQTRQIESHLAEARTDALTGLPNRRAFDDELARRIAEWRRKRATFCLLLIDIDRFKQLNDRYGHPAGDHALRGVADVLRHVLREMDMVARIGGEDFATLLPSTDFRDAVRAAGRVGGAVAAETFRFEREEIRLTVSLGLARVEAWDDPVSLVKRADEALYSAKGGGRNCAFCHDGNRCRRIESGDAAELAERPSTPDADNAKEAYDDPAEMTAIWSDLRDRLAQMMNP
jgi:diguanylate cyclase